MLVPFQFTTQTIETMCRWSPRITHGFRRDGHLRRFWVHDILGTWRRKGVLVCSQAEYKLLCEHWYDNLPDHIKSLYDITKFPRIDRNKFGKVESEFPFKLVTLVCDMPPVYFDRKCNDGSIESLFYAFSKSKQVDDMQNMTKITTDINSKIEERFQKLVLPFLSIEKEAQISLFDPYTIDWANGDNKKLHLILHKINEYSLKLDVKKTISIYATKRFSDKQDETDSINTITKQMADITNIIQHLKNINLMVYIHVYKSRSVFNSHKSYIHDRFIKFGDNHVLDIGRGVDVFAETSALVRYSTFVAHKLVEDVSEYKKHLDDFRRAGLERAITNNAKVIIVDKDYVG